jgi:hypothetical protein
MKFGSPALPDRFWRKVEVSTEGCWTWLAGRFGNGYPAFYSQGRMMPAHRVCYVAAHGVIEGGLDIDHLCRNPLCVNPDHLEAVTHRENILRGTGFAARHAVKTHCPQGHEYTDENTRVYRGMRNCRRCAHEKTMRRTNEGYFRDQMARKRSMKGK